jgi:origin recognition complex subunit 2
MAAIVNTLLPDVTVLGSLSNQVELIHDYMDSAPGYITLLIHNIEGQGLLKPEVYSTLAKLASHCRIYTIASSDHINTPLLFDMNLMTDFNFLWHDVTSYSPYTVETSFENLICEVGGENGASYVLQSLTSSTKRLFNMLCRHQLGLSLPNDKIHDSSSGLSFDALFSKASRDFIVQELGSFRIMLTEFRDHGLIVGEMKDGVEMLYVPFSNDTINELLE